MGELIWEGGYGIESIPLAFPFWLGQPHPLLDMFYSWTSPSSVSSAS